MSDTELLHKSRPEPVRRLEVFTGAGRRRAWTAEQQVRILAESYESGDKVSAVARRHGLTPQQLFGWRREARRRVRRQAKDGKGDVSGAAFAPVIVEPVLPSTDAPSAPNSAGAAGAIEIVIGAATVRVARGPDDARYVLQRAKCCHGFYGASSMERLPTEIALTDQTRRFKEITF